MISCADFGFGWDSVSRVFVGVVLGVIGDGDSGGEGDSKGDDGGGGGG